MSAQKHITLSQLLTNIRQTLSAAYPLGQWISAEIGSLNVNRYSGHCYMELIEKSSANSTTPQARVQAAAWRSHWGALSAYFESVAGEPLRAGMKVLLKVSVNFHEAYGLSLVVNDIDPAYTLGEQAALRQQTIAQLEADGVINLNKQLPRPTPIQRIAVVSSATAAGLQDFRNHLSASPWHFEVSLFEAIMQGQSAEESIIGALERIALSEDDFDAVVVIRGGGSQTDLECFNSYALCSNLAQFPLPILTGIGHDRDQSVADMVAHIALKTPTAVADYLVEQIEGFAGEMEYTYDSILNGANAMLTAHNQRLERNATLTQSSASALLRRLDIKLEGAALRIHNGSIRLLEGQLARLARIEATVNGNNPQRILSLGFAIVRTAGKAITDTASLSVGTEVEITLAHGQATAQINNIKSDSTTNE